MHFIRHDTASPKQTRGWSFTSTLLTHNIVNKMSNIHSCFKWGTNTSSLVKMSNAIMWWTWWKWCLCTSVLSKMTTFQSWLPLIWPSPFPRPGSPPVLPRHWERYLLPPQPPPRSEQTPAMSVMWDGGESKTSGQSGGCWQVSEMREGGGEGDTWYSKASC